MPVINMPPLLKSIIGDLEKRVRKLEQSPARATYGSFFDITTQTIASTTQVYPVAIGSTEFAYRSSVTSGSRITVENAGVYNFAFSLQLTNSSAQAEDAYIWIRINGVDDPNSTAQVTVPAKHGSINGGVVAAWNFYLTLGNGGYVQLYWAATSTAVTMPYLPAGTSPVYPAIPSVIATIHEITYSVS